VCLRLLYRITCLKLTKSFRCIFHLHLLLSSGSAVSSWMAWKSGILYRIFWILWFGLHGHPRCFRCITFIIVSSMLSRAILLWWNIRRIGICIEIAPLRFTDLIFLFHMALNIDNVVLSWIILIHHLWVFSNDLLFLLLILLELLKQFLIWWLISWIYLPTDSMGWILLLVCNWLLYFL